jgi:putative hydrolase of the HAD superfamily
MMAKLKIIAFDADDTLWHNEPLFISTRQSYVEMLSQYHEESSIESRLYETEMKNLRHFGYGVKSFTLSMIETAIELTEGRLEATSVGEIIKMGKEMIMHPTELLPDVESTITTMAEDYRLMIVTKGDLFDQEAKIARSGLGDLFTNVEVLSNKTVAAYANLLSRYELMPDEIVMVGNSLKSDILPLCELGCHAIFVPYATTWEHEHVEDMVANQYDYHTAQKIGEIPEIVSAIGRKKGSPVRKKQI